MLWQNGDNMKLVVTIERDEDGLYVAECPAIPGCVSQGKTREQALKNIQEAAMADPFTLDQYHARRKVLAAFTPKFHVYDPAGQLVAYVEQKAFKLKEDITVFADEQKQRPLLTIRARQVLDISATYDVSDARTGQKVGALRRKGLKSIMRDEWTVLDAGDQELGTIQED